MKSFKESLASVIHSIPVVVKTTDLEFENHASPAIINFDQASRQTTSQDHEPSGKNLRRVTVQDQDPPQSQNPPQSLSRQVVEIKQNPPRSEPTNEDKETFVKKPNMFKRFWKFINTKKARNVVLNGTSVVVDMMLPEECKLDNVIMDNLKKLNDLSKDDLETTNLAKKSNSLHKKSILKDSKAKSSSDDNEQRETGLNENINPENDSDKKTEVNEKKN